MLTSADLLSFIAAHQLSAELVSLTVPTETVLEAARALNTSPEQIVKSILLLVDDQPVLAIAGGVAHIDKRKVAAYFGVGRKKVRIADPQAVLEITGYPVGAMPPFGHQRPLPTLVDPGLLEMVEVFAGGGELNALLRLAPGEILRQEGAVALGILENVAGAGDD